MRLGYRLNFGEARMIDGITRTVNRPVEEDQQFLCVLGGLARTIFISHYPQSSPEW